MFLNKQRAIDIMRERGMDALITTSQANNTYLSDLPINGFCILTSEGDGTIIARALDSFILAEAPSWIKDVRLYGLFHIFPSDSKRLSGLEERLNDIVLKGELTKARAPLDVLVESILEKGLDNKNLGVDGNGIGPSQFGMLTKRLPKAKLNDAVQDLSWIRAVKTPEEVARIETITKITEKGFDAVEEAAIEGISERELAVAFRKFLAAEEEVAIGMCKFLCGSRGAAPLTPISDYRLKKGELIQLHASLNRKYYHSDIARGAVAGQPSEKQRAVWKAIVKGEEEIIKHVRPGVKASELFRIGVQAVSAFLPRYERWHTGHGLGLTGVKEYDPPTLSPHDERELEENMVLSIETPYYEIGFGGMNLEDTGVVTKSGFRIFSSHRADLKSV